MYEYNVCRTLYTRKFLFGRRALMSRVIKHVKYVNINVRLTFRLFFFTLRGV